MLSVVIPTYNERPNIEPLLSAVSEVLSQIEETSEIIIVDDDSPDGTAEEAARFDGTGPVRVIVRKNERGLATAVLRGIEEAHGELVAVMDADLSHQPSGLLTMYERLTADGADLVVGSRFVEGGGIENWTRWRGFVSWVARMLSRGICPIKDSTSGFFMFRKAILDGVDLAPYGYKICLELLVKSRVKKVAEAPIMFRDRAHGNSKLDSRTTLAYIFHLIALYIWIIFRASPTKDVGPTMTFARFSIVGLSGVVVNYGLFTLLRLVSGLPHMLAAFLAIETSIITNFAINNFWTWRHRHRGGGSKLLERGIKYHVVAGLAAFGGNWATLYILVDVMGLNINFSYLFGIALGMLINYVLNDRWTFARDLWENGHQAGAMTETTCVGKEYGKS